ncbi:MAG: hypothetical protein Q4C58_06060 [Eubacteriales bacterium]|nr:hypothetical protein [Eubacteriales bacterium]
MRKSLALMLASVVMMLGLAGCGSGESAVTATTIEIRKDGSVIHTIVEEFSEDYYDVEALGREIQDACDSYNATAGSGAVATGEVEVTDGVLTVQMTYQNASAYAGFNKQALFTGSVKDAYNAGYDLDVTLYSIQDDGEAIGKEDLLNMGEKHIVILREAVDVRVWNKVLYVSGDVVKTGDSRLVMVGGGNELSYIVFE